MTGPLNAFTQCFVQMANFRGRATPSEFWWVYGLFASIGLVACAADAFMLMRLVETSGEAGVFALSPFDFSTVLVSLVSFLPLTSLSVRRLHDAGFSGMWWFAMLVPVVGPLALLVMMALPTCRDTTVYGSPRAAVPPPVAAQGKVKLEDAQKRAMQGYALLFDQDKKVTPEMAAARKAEISDYYKSRVLKPVAEI